SINTVVLNADCRYRVLEILSQGFIWIDIDSDSAFPEQINVDVIDQLFNDEKLKLQSDPYGELVNETVEQGSKHQTIRDERMNLIAPLIGQKDVYFRATRGKLVKKRCAETDTPKKTIYKLLRQYWQRGCVPNALLPDYRNAGGKGKKKVPTKKSGRRRTISPGQGSIVDAS